MATPVQLVMFRLEGQRYAVRLAVVERIVRAVAVTSLPDAPAIVLGAIDVAGRIIPVLNVRRRLGLPERDIGVPDQFLIARTTRRPVALVVDEALGLVEIPAAAIVESVQIVPGLGFIEGVVVLPDGLALIHDLESFLSLEEAETLGAVLSREVTGGS
jgi:purine-binding chemotaxis protein CheW